MHFYFTKPSGRYREGSGHSSKNFCVASGLLLAAFMAGAPLLPSSQTAAAYTIEGKVEHVETMPAVERRFAPGIEFDQSVELSPNNIWIKVPNWLAGAWSANDETVVFRQDFRNGRVNEKQETFKAKQEFNYGQQIDKSGQVWHYMGVPYTSKSARSQAQEIHEVKEKELVPGGENELTFRAVATVLLVDTFNSRIKRTYQQESLTTYRSIGDDRLSMTASTKVFDAAGQAQSLQKNEATIKRARHFKQINVKDGKDLQALFKQFLIAKGLGDQVADDIGTRNANPTRKGNRDDF